MSGSATLGVVTTDRGLVIRGWNEWLSSATGVTEAGVVGRPLIDFVASGREDFYRDLLADVIDSGTPRVLAPAFHHYLIECAPRQPSSHFSHMQQRVTVAPLRNDAEVVGVLITLEDVTQRLDEERVMSERLARQSAAERTGVAATLASDDWRLRQQAVRVLKQSATVDEVRHLLDTLQRDHHDLNILNSALRVLIASGRTVVEPLIKLLHDGAPNLRMHAALALGELGAFDAVPALVAALGDPDDNVRFHAIEALGRLGSPDAVEPLSAIATSGNFFLAFGAIDALSKTDDARVAPLIETLLDQDALRPAAVTTLASIGDEDSVAALCRTLNSGHEAAGVGSALAGIYRRYDETLKAGNIVIAAVQSTVNQRGIEALASAAAASRPNRLAAATVLSWLGTPALPALLALAGDRELEGAVIDGVIAAGDPAVDALVPLLEHDQPRVRASAAALLGRLGSRRSLEPLQRALNDPDHTVVANAAGAIATLRHADTLESLFELFQHPAASVRRAAVAAINSMGIAGTIPLVLRALAQQDPQVRESALRVAGYFGFHECAPAIAQALIDPDEDVRRAAIEQLPVFDEAEAVAGLIRAVQEETPRNRAAAAHALRLVDGVQAGAALVRALGDEHAWVRYFAALALADAHRPADAATALAALAQQDPATHVRIAAITTLTAVDARLGAEIASALTNEQDDDLAAAAVAALGTTQVRAGLGPLIAAAKSPRSALRSAAIRALGARPVAEAIEVLAWAARSVDDAAQAGSAIEGISRILSAAPPSIRRAAADALLELIAEGTRRDAVLSTIAGLSEDTVPDLASGLSSMRTAVRIAAVDALAAVRQPRASRELARALKDEDASVRSAAVVAFGKLGTPAVARTIAALRQTDPDQGVRQRAVRTCERHGWTIGPVERV